MLEGRFQGTSDDHRVGLVLGIGEQHDSRATVYLSVAEFGRGRLPHIGDVLEPHTQPRMRHKHRFTEQPRREGLADSANHNALIAVIHVTGAADSGGLTSGSQDLIQRQSIGLKPIRLYRTWSWRMSPPNTSTLATPGTLST